ncbi:MAG: flagellar basal body L-ring protein FlgH [Planctomycetota bacterium]|jgi:flagellar L-ring protein precursor FlgH
MSLTGKLVICGLAAVLFGGSAANAGSIWAKGSRRTCQLFTDSKAQDLGDVLTIVIEEDSKIENETSRKMDKTTARKAEMDGTLDLANILQPIGEHIFDFPKLDFTSSSSTEFDGGADYGTDRSMDDKITVVVEDVQPNGNLVVLGSRTRDVAGDKQIIQISGIVRPEDITFDNTISSSRVANFHIVHKTIGRENRFTKPGWLGRLANLLNPF